MTVPLSHLVTIVGRAITLRVRWFAVKSRVVRAFSADLAGGTEYRVEVAGLEARTRLQEKVAGDVNEKVAPALTTAATSLPAQYGFHAGLIRLSQTRSSQRGGALSSHLHAILGHNGPVRSTDPGFRSAVRCAGTSA
jgi:hypothetical protein